MELVVVVIIMGMLAGLSVPRYHKTKIRNQEKAAYRAMMMIRSAVNIYVVAEESNIPDMGNINLISAQQPAGLGISLYAIDDISIACLGTGADGDNECTATHSDGWTLRFHESSQQQVYCSSGDGTCPTCMDDGIDATADGCFRLD